VKQLFASALAETALISWRDLSATKYPPLPSDYAAVIIVWGLLSFLPEGGGQKTATLVGWGFVAATWMNMWSPASPTKLALPGSTPAAKTPGVSAPGTTTIGQGNQPQQSGPAPAGHGGRAGSGPQ
jgi:hypothetical protein